MKTVYALAAAGLLALSLPAFAQNAGSAGATGTGTGLTGRKAGTGYATPNTAGKGMTGSPTGMSEDSTRMNEGRAAAPNMTNTPQDPANNAPTTVRGDQNGHGTAKP